MVLSVYYYYYDYYTRLEIYALKKRWYDYCPELLVLKFIHVSDVATKKTDLKQLVSCDVQLELHATKCLNTVSSVCRSPFLEPSVYNVYPPN
jgi:hypothetical protein